MAKRGKHPGMRKIVAYVPTRKRVHHKRRSK